MNENENETPWVVDLASAAQAAGFHLDHGDDTGFVIALNGDTPEDLRPCRLEVQLPPESEVALVRVNVRLPWHSGEVDLMSLRSSLSVINDRLTVGVFEADDDGTVHLRDSMFWDVRTPPSTLVVGHWLGALAHHQVHYGDFVEIACDGSVPPESMAGLVDSAEKLISADLD